MIASHFQENDQESNDKEEGLISGLNLTEHLLLTERQSPFVLMILVLVLVSSQGLDRFLGLFPGRIGRSLAGFFRVTPPSALGKRFERE